MKKLILNVATGCMTAMLLFSCTQEEIESSQLTNTDTNPHFSTQISEEEALSNLKAFMKGDNTRSDDNREVESIYPVKYIPQNTRSNTTPSDTAALVYIANFKNEEGYAILAADQSMPNSIIAIIDEGTLDEKQAYAAVAIADSNNKYVFDDYPTTGPGFFSIEETGDEIYMNPNTVNLYDKEKDDTLCGDYYYDDEEFNNKIGGANTSNIDSHTTSNLFTLAMCMDYAMKVKNINTYTGEVYPLKPGTGAIDPGAGYGELTVKTETTDWEILNNISPMLTQFKYWHQWSPFNDYYPKRRKYLVFGSSRKAPAGCFPLAIAKIFTHFRTPTLFTYNGSRVDWQALSSNFLSDTGKRSAASLLMGISIGCDSWYFYNGTFTFPSDAIKYMARCGYSQAKKYQYTWDRTIEMLDNNKPTIMYSIGNTCDLTRSHCWNVDGYRIRQRTVTKTWYEKGVKTKQTVTKEISKMVHCDFGWAGKHNGYYVDGIFQLNGEGAEPDPGSESSGHTNYKNYLHVVVY